MSEELFGAVQAQLEENRQRRRDRPRGGRYLVQGLVVCKRCGYACYGKPVSRAAAKGKVPYAYYRCTGTDAYRFGGQPCAGISRSAPMSWTPRSGKTCVSSCPSPNEFGRSTSGGCKGRRRAQNARRSI